MGAIDRALRPDQPAARKGGVHPQRYRPAVGLGAAGGDRPAIEGAGAADAEAVERAGAAEDAIEPGIAGDRQRMGAIDRAPQFHRLGRERSIISQNHAIARVTSGRYLR